MNGAPSTVDYASDSSADAYGETIDDAWSGGFVCGLLTARFYALRHTGSDAFYQSPAPTEVPGTVLALMSAMCRGAIDEHLFRTSWRALDVYLTADSISDLHDALRAGGGSRVQ